MADGRLGDVRVPHRNMVRSLNRQTKRQAHSYSILRRPNSERIHGVR